MVGISEIKVLVSLQDSLLIFLSSPKIILNYCRRFKKKIQILPLIVETGCCFLLKGSWFLITLSWNLWNNLVVSFCFAIYLFIWLGAWAHPVVRRGYSWLVFGSTLGTEQSSLGAAGCTLVLEKAWPPACRAGSAERMSPLSYLSGSWFLICIDVKTHSYINLLLIPFFSISFLGSH